MLTKEKALYSRKEHTEHKDIKRIMDNLEWVD